MSLNRYRRKKRNELQWTGLVLLGLSWLFRAVELPDAACFFSGAGFGFLGATFLLKGEVEF